MSYSQVFTLNVLDADYRDRIKPSAILNFFQEAATNNFAGSHAEHLEHGQFWVITRTAVEVVRLPKRLDTVVVETWQNKPRRADIDREYLLRTESGETLIKGSSKWCLLSSDTRAILRIADCAFPDFPSEEQPRMIEGGSKKVPPVSDKAEGVARFKVMPSVLDINSHVNNAKYADYVYDSFTLEELEKNIKSFTINYIQEVRAGERLTAYRERTESGAYLVELRSGDETPVLRAEVVFEP